MDIELGGAVVDDACAESEVTVNGGVGEVDATAAYDAIENAAIEVVEIR